MPANFKYVVPAQGQFLAHTWATNGEVLVCLTQPGDIPSEHWDKFLADVRAPGVKGVLGLSIGSVAVNSLQRKSLSEATKGKVLVAVLENRVTRGIITALGWIGLTIRAYGWDKLDDSYKYLRSEGLDTEGLPEVTAKLMKDSQAPSIEKLASGTSSEA